MGGTDITEDDLKNIQDLSEQVLSLTEYRGQLFEYLQNRMRSIAPNLTCMVGELVGARLISHAGSLMNPAKQPASTVQILGAEKALFRALKTKSDTPKYGLISHASLVGQAAPKNKGKISRVLAAKCALSIRVDALGDTSVATIGIEDRVKGEERLRQLEGKTSLRANSDAKVLGGPSKYDGDGGAAGYNPAGDSTLSSKKRKKESDDEEEEEEAAPKKKKEKKEKKAKKEKAESDSEEEEAPKK